jgi:hypothetical protein
LVSLAAIVDPVYHEDARRVEVEKHSSGPEAASRPRARLRQPFQRGSHAPLRDPVNRRNHAMPPEGTGLFASQAVTALDLLQRNRLAAFSARRVEQCRGLRVDRFLFRRQLFDNFVNFPAVSHVIPVLQQA